MLPDELSDEQSDQQPDEPTAGAASRLPWVTAVVAGLVLVALLVTYFAFLRGDVKDADRERAANRHLVLGDLNEEENAAVDAAATEMLNLVSFRRAQFDQDWSRALAGVTGSLKSDVEKNRQTTLTAITNGKFDMSGKVTHKALEGPVGSGSKRGYTVLVTIEGYRSTAADIPVQQNLEVTVVRQGTKWLANDIQNIGI